MKEMIEFFSHLLRQIGGENFLTIGIVIIVFWLLISGFKKGLKRKGRDKDSEGSDNGE